MKELYFLEIIILYFARFSVRSSISELEAVMLADLRTEWFFETTTLLKDTEYWGTFPLHRMFDGLNTSKVNALIGKQTSMHSKCVYNVNICRIYYIIHKSQLLKFPSFSPLFLSLDDFLRF